MQSVINILRQIGATSSRNEKVAILKANRDNALLAKAFEYTYNPYKVYGIGPKAFKSTEEKCEFSDIFALLDYLLTHNTGSDVDKAKVNAFLSANVDNATWYVKMISKDLKIGLTATTINKVYPGLIPSFDVMLAFPFDRLFKKVAIEPKIDGCRCVAIKDNGSVHLFTRNGKPIEGFKDIEAEICKIPLSTFVFDGEIVGKDYKDTMNKLFAKCNKKMATYMIFDMLTLEEFKIGYSARPFLLRKEQLRKVAGSCKYETDSLTFVFPIRVIDNPTMGQLKALMEDAVAHGFEGIMVKDANGAYECKRSYLWQKMKPFETAEFPIVGYEEGEGKLRGMLGKVLVDVDGVVVGVGSGWSEEERKDIWAHRKQYMGRLVEVQYQEKTKDGALRFPTVRGFRFDIT